MLHAHGTCVVILCVGMRVTWVIMLIIDLVCCKMIPFLCHGTYAIFSIDGRIPTLCHILALTHCR
jgi:hypothetical protein